MISPLQIDSYTRDQWQEFDALAIAQLAPVAYDSCYRPRLYVALDSIAQMLPTQANGGYVSYKMHVLPGSLMYGIQIDGVYGTQPAWMMQITDEAMGLKLFSDPVSQAFLANSKGPNYPYLFRHPRPVVGEGSFKVEVWNQLDDSQSVVPVFAVLEVKE